MRQVGGEAVATASPQSRDGGSGGNGTFPPALSFKADNASIRSLLKEESGSFLKKRTKKLFR
jgi:hypothetical protein